LGAAASVISTIGRWAAKANLPGQIGTDQLRESLVGQHEIEAARRLRNA